MIVTKVLKKLTNDNRNYYQPKGIQKKIAFIISKFVKNAMVNDYCLVYYESGFDFDAEVTPACLPKSESAVENGKSCYVAGWGKLRYF